MTDGQKLGLGITGLAALLLWALNRKNLLHESVAIKVGGQPITPQGTIPPDPVTGAPQFDHTIDATVPANEELAIPPIDGDGIARYNVIYPKKASCPQGYLLWKDAANGNYECIPS